MDKKQAQIRAVERKYSRLKRQSVWEKRKKHLPRILIFVLLAAAAVIAVWLLTRPHTELPDAALCVSVLDVGQGDAILVQTKTHSVLIDAGTAEQSDRLVNLLHEYNVQRLDCLICSHPHGDHIGGMPAVLEAFPVGMICLPQIPEALIPTGWTFQSILDTAEEKAIPVQVPVCGEILPLGDAALTFLCTDNAAFEDLNNCSLCCRIECGAQSFFCTGDLGTEGEAAMLAAGLIRPASVLKVGHHGSSTSTSAAFLEAIRPQYAVISCGAQNEYGHPAGSTLRALSDAGCTVYRTDFDGTVIFTTDGSSVQIKINSPLLQNKQ